MLAAGPLRDVVRAASLSRSMVLVLLGEGWQQTGLGSGRDPSDEGGAIRTDARLAGETRGACCAGSIGEDADKQCKGGPHVGAWQHWTTAGDGRCGAEIVNLNEAGLLHLTNKQAMHRRSFHSTVHLAAKRKKSDDGFFQSEFFHYESFVNGKKVNNKASHKKQKRMEAKARLAEIRDWLNNQPKSGWTYTTFQVSRAYEEELKGSEARRARQSRRDRQKGQDADWFFGGEPFWAWQQEDAETRKSHFFEDLNSGFFWGFDTGGEEDASYQNDSHHKQSATQTPRKVPLCPHRKCLELPQRQPLTLASLKEAFRKQALKWHPDRHPDSSKAGAEVRFKEAATAYQALKVIA